ncbi:hypothetical protein [Shewanella khirikhana]|uniref:Uncharacterized protein n=1 Tax=Shewanella khirikhana TaxID=1965282 RepID=A0ABM7DBN7_9GAMM|nr:hypothetical protein [Shewanella khirikhana]AZQ11378.1 hypothetical protein STH12_02292 [Shewanella khirikhana]
MNATKSVFAALLFVLGLLFAVWAGAVQASAADHSVESVALSGGQSCVELCSDFDGIFSEINGIFSDINGTSGDNLPVHLDLSAATPLAAKVLGSGSHHAGSSLPLGKDLNIPRSFRWQVLQSQWQRDFAPEYQLLFELAMPSSPELEPGRIEPKPPQVQWVLGPQTGGTLRPGGWKDTNLQFRFIQQADFSLA